MPNQPIPLRKVTLITKWTADILAQLLTEPFFDVSYILFAYEWIEGRPEGVVSSSTMRRAIQGIDSETDEVSKVAIFPAHFFVWSDELREAYDTYHHYLSNPGDLDEHDAFELNPATHGYTDLLAECPNFSSNPNLIGNTPTTRRELRTQQTVEKRALWQVKAEELRREYPDDFKIDIARKVRRALRETAEVDTIRKNIRIKGKR